MRALDPATGRQRWSFDGGGSYGSDLSVVDAAGNVYFGTEAGRVYGYAPDGNQLFDLDTGSVVGTLVIGNQSGEVYALRG